MQKRSMLKAHIQAKVVGIALTAFVVSTGAHGAAADSMKVGNCAGRAVSYQKVANADVAGAALFYPEATMRAYRGCRITAVEIGLRDKTGRDSVEFFVTHALDGEPLYSETFTATKSGMPTFRLSDPYAIDGTAVFIGYKVKGAKMLSLSNALVSDEEWVLKDSAGWKPYDNSTGLCNSLRLTLKGDSLPGGDIRLTGMVMPEYAQADSSVAFRGSFVNLGADRVSQLTVSYVADGQTVGTETVGGLAVEPRRTGSFNLSSLHFAAEGEPRVRVVVSEVNGEADAVPADNASREAMVVVRDSFAKRKTLLEVFSTELCPQCPAGHEELNRVLGGKSDVVEVGHHAGFYTDTLTVDASVAYEWFYGGGTFAPAIMFDRTCLADNYPSTFGSGSPLVNIADGVVASLHEAMAGTPAIVSIGLGCVADAKSRRVDISVSGKQLLPVATPDSLRLFVYLTEDSIFTTNQRGSGGSFWHRHSLRQSVTPTWGDRLDGDGGEFSLNYEAAIPQQRNMERMSVVAFVANVNATDKCDCRVMNAEEVALIEGGASAIDDVADADAHEQSGATVLDLAGHVVARLADWPSAEPPVLKRGVYVVRYLRGGKATARKVAVF